MGDFEKSLQNIDINFVYDQISKIEVPLEMQSTYNRHYIDQKIVECDKALDLLDKTNTSVVRELTNYEIRCSIVDEEINNKKRNEFANNEKLMKKYGTGKEREAAVELLMGESLTDLNKLTRKIMALRSLSGLIKTKQSIIIKKMRNIQDQARMMSDLLKVNVPLPDDRDTASLSRALGSVEALERSLDLDAENVEESTEFIEPVEEEKVTETAAEPEVSADSDSLDISFDEPESKSSPVTSQESKGSTSAEIDTSELDLGNIEVQGPAKAESTSAPAEEESEPATDENSEDGEDSDLTMDTVLDGLDCEEGSTGEGSGVAVDPEPEASNGTDGDMDTTLEDLLPSNVPVVTEKPAKKSGQGEPSAKDKSPKKSDPPAEKPSAKKVLKEEAAVVPGDVNIDNILDDLNNL